MKKEITKYLKEWQNRCYFDGIPDEVPIRIEQLNKAPSYKAIVRAIIKNDVQLKTLGFEPKKCNVYHEIKREELMNRNKCVQLKLF